jgi:hypothetical protein
MDAYEELLSKVNISGEIEATELFEKFFPEDLLNNLHDSVKKGFVFPLSESFKKLYTKINTNLQKVDDKKIEKLVDPFGLSELSKEYKAKIDAYKKNMVKFLDRDFSKTDPNLPNIPQAVINTKAAEVVPESVKNINPSDDEQKSFGPKEVLINFSQNAKEFLIDLMGSQFDHLEKQLNYKRGRDVSANAIGDQDAGGGFSLGKLLGAGTMVLLAGVAGLVGAFMTDGPLKGTLELIGKGGLKGGLMLLAKKLFGTALKTTLKRIPILGTLLSYGFAWQRFSNGDTVGGIIDLVSGTVQLLDFVAPGVGTALSIGVDVLQAVMDYKGGGSSAEASAKKANILGDWVSGVWNTLKKTPFIGGWFRSVSGLWGFLNGIISGDLSKARMGLVEASEGGGYFGAFPSLMLGLFDIVGGKNEQGKTTGIDYNSFMKNFKTKIGKSILAMFSWMPNSWQKSIADFLGVKMDGNPEDTKIGTPANPQSMGSAFNQTKLEKTEVEKFKEENKDVLTNKWKFGTQEQIDAQKKLDELEKKQKEQLANLQQINQQSEKKDWETDEFMKNQEQMKKLSEISSKYSQKGQFDVADREEARRKELEKRNLEIQQQYYRDQEQKKRQQQQEQLFKDIPEEKEKYEQSQRQQKYTPSDIDDYSANPEDQEKEFSMEDGEIPQGRTASIRGTDGNIYKTGRKDTIIAAKPDGVIVKTLMEIKTIMSSVNKELLAKSKESAPNISNVNVSSSSGGGGGTYFDPILRSRQSWIEQSTKRV